MMLRRVIARLVTAASDRRPAAGSLQVAAASCRRVTAGSRRHVSAALLLAIGLLSHHAAAEAWPTFRRDAHRSGRSSEQLDVDSLAHAWTHVSPHPPQPAWAGPAKWDAYATLTGLRSMRNYDPVFHVIAADGRTYFGSSVDDSVHCLDTSTGRELWVHTTDAPIRIAPTLVDGKLYFGSDDGHAYCIHAKDGKLVWSFSPSPEEPRVLHNGRLIAKWPVRSGVLVGDGTAYFAASLFPWKASYLCAVDAETGEPSGKGRYLQTFPQGLTFEGPLLASEKLMLFPQGRIPPLLFRRQTGAQLGALHKDGGGGSFVLMTDDRRIYHGPGNKGGWITSSDAASRAKLASFPNANAMVVSENRAFVLTDLNLKAIDRETLGELWSVPASYPYELILAGNTLLAGGEDEIAAYDAATGNCIWSAPVDGRAYGIAIADGTILASTNSGAIHAFRAGIDSPAPMPWVKDAVTHDEQAAGVGKLKSVDDPDLAARWVFGRHTVAQRKGLPQQLADLAGGTVQDLAGKHNATILGSTRVVRVGEMEAVPFDGVANSALVTGDIAKANLPAEQISVTAWVRVDRTSSWGGILGAIQDNGDFERGWLLGYRDRRFAFAVCGKNGPGRLTYLTAPADFTLQRWHHVAGTYDGTTMRLWVDGEIVAETDAQQGPIHYPDQAFFEIGAYHDKDEYFRLNGMLHEVRLYGRALSHDELRKQSAVLSERFPQHLKIADGPVLRFDSPSQATIRWWTDFKTPSRVTLTYNGQSRTYRSGRRTTEHEVTVDVPRRDTVYRYQIEAIRDGQPLVSAVFDCDTFFNHALRPVADTETADATPSAAWLNSSRIREGICVIFGADETDSVLDIVRQSRLRIVIFETDVDEVRELRNHLLEAGAYGSRVAVHHVGSFSKLAAVPGIADLIVYARPLKTEDMGVAMKTITDLLVPARGVAFVRLASSVSAEEAKTAVRSGSERAVAERVVRLGDDARWLRFERSPYDGAGEWSHQYGRADNSAFGGESLADATSTDDLEVVWLGRPGPRAQADRNGRKPSPLATGGKLFMQGLERLTALNAHNGTILWSLEMPTIGRFNIPRDASNWCADTRHLFVAAGDQIWQIDAAKGDIVARHDVAAGPQDEGTYEWGYVGRLGDLLIGSTVKSDAPFTSFWGKDAWYDAESGPATFKVCSDNLFAVDVDSARRIWQYNGGVIVNSTITAADGKIFFAESRNRKIVDGQSRRIGSAELWNDLHLVAIDAASGSQLWEQPLDDIHPGTVIVYLAHGSETLALVTSGSVRYGIYTFEPSSGKERWRAELGWAVGKADHGSHLQRPAIVGDRLFVRPAVYDLSTGNKQDIRFPWKKCGTYACTTKAMFFRHDNTTMWSAVDGSLSGWTRLRPGCWLSTIPAHGLLLAPEAGGGCSCGNWLETSIVFAPRRE